MRLILNEEAKASLEQIQTCCKEFNPDIEPSTSGFLTRLLCSINSTLSKEQWSDISVQLTSERVQRKRMRERLLRLGEKLDQSDIEKLEQKIERKHAAKDSEKRQIAAENS